MAKEAREQAQATGQLPHEFLLSVARGELVGGVVPKLEQRIDAAKAAAPYYAPRLSASDVNVRENPLKEMFDLLDATHGRRGLI